MALGGTQTSAHGVVRNRC